MQFHKINVAKVATPTQKIFSLSKTAPNVFILMQDKLCSNLVQVALQRQPRLKQGLEGFVFYPNCASPAHLTMLGTPGIFAGYDYTPYYINKMPEQQQKTLQQKHNEAILSLPIVFHNAGFSVSVVDMPYENYLEYPVETIYKDYPFVNRIAARGAYSDFWYKKHNIKKIARESTLIKRNFIWFSLFKITPPVFRQVIYHGEYWLSFDTTRKFSKFIDNYSVIEFLGDLTKIEDTKQGSFILMDNEATHEVIPLQEPDYVPAYEVHNTKKDKINDSAQYQATVGILLQFCNFIKYLKENGVYDNTKIIIVSDHGGSLDTGNFGKDIELKGSLDYDGHPYRKADFSASLFVKDFNSKDPLKQDGTFMCNADTPALATQGLIENAKNPFTGSLFFVPQEQKKDVLHIAAALAESTRVRKNKQFAIKQSDWFLVKDDIYKDENWKQGETW